MASIFDELIPRENTGCAKYDSRHSVFGTEDILPFWIADMDFKAPEPVIEALRAKVNHGIFGYPVSPDHYFDSIVTWLYRRHGWKVEKEWITFCPGVVPALSMAVLAFSRAGDRVAVQPPVYFPFFRTIESQNRIRINNPLNLREGKYLMDLNDLEEKAGQGLSMIFLCNPHNPGGRVWKREELEKLAELCTRKKILVVSDEIHSDIIFSGQQHIPLASLGIEIASRTVTCMAPSKTFNLAGLSSSFVVIPDPDKRSQFDKLLHDYNIYHGNIFGLEAMKSAYEKGGRWLEELIQYLQENLRLTEDFFEHNIPEVKVMKPEGTYLVWLDFRKLGMGGKELNDFLVREAGIGLSPGYLFGPGGEGFERLNIACPRSRLAEGLSKLSEALRRIRLS